MIKQFQTVFQIAVCSLVAMAIWANAQSADFVGNTYNVGGRPAGVASADVNGDGKPDLISVNNLANTLTVLTNSGSGGFHSNATYTVGGGPLAVIAADVNGDGKPDLISANNLANTLTVLTNKGGGIFGSNATLTVGSYPAFVTSADVNGDGRPDLISANNNANTLTVLTNNGNGVFGSNATLSVGSRPYGVAAADVNADGKVDLVSANYNAHTLTVLTNEGSGSFGFAATLAVNGYPNSMVAADINGDGNVDLISANLSVFPNAGTLTVLTNNGSGGFGSNTVANVGRQPFSVAAADVNGDGRLDLITANFGDNTLTVLTQTSGALPALTLAATSSNTVVISWPVAASGFVLQTNADLRGPNWGPAGYLITTNGATKSINIAPSANQMFFRLEQ